MNSPRYDDDDAMLDSLMDAMEGYDANHLFAEQKPQGATVIEMHIHPNGKAEEAPKEEKEPELTDEAMLPTPDELDELMKRAG